MARVFVSTSPKALSDLELAKHANEIIGYINGNKIVGALMLVSGGVLAYQTGSISYYSCLFGLGGGFFVAQGRLSILAERIKRLEKQLEL